MKSSDQPELKAAWLKNNKPVGYNGPGLSNALKDWEIAADSMDAAKRTKAAADLKGAVKKVISSMDSTKYKDEIVVLEKYKKLTEAEELKTKEMAERGSAPAGAPVPQKMGGPVVIWSRDISVEVKKQFKKDWLTDFSGYELEMTLNSDILDVFEKEEDKVTPAFIAQDAEELAQELISILVKTLDEIEASSKGKKPADVDKLRESFEPAAASAIKVVEGKMKQIPLARWDLFVRQKQQYKSYKIKSGLNVTLGVLGIAGSAVGIAGTGGAGLALGIVTLVRSSAALMKQIHDLYIEAEKVEKDLKKDLDTLMERYAAATNEIRSGRLASTEITGSTLKTILGVDPPFMATIPKCKNNIDLWQSKVAGITVEGRKLYKAVSIGLAQCDKLEGMIAKAEKKEARAIYDKLVKARKKLDEALGKCSDMNARVDKAEKNFEGLDQMMKALEAATPKYVEIFDKVFPVVVNLTLSGASGGVGIKEANSTLEVVNSSLSMFNDVVSEGKAKLEEYLG
jgi:hypothetical protein